MATFIDNIVLDSSYIFGKINTQIKQLDYTRVLKRETEIASKLRRDSDWMTGIRFLSEARDLFLLCSVQTSPEAIQCFCWVKAAGV
jgi:hypothetical protein